MNIEKIQKAIIGLEKSRQSLSAVVRESLKGSDLTEQQLRCLREISKHKKGSRASAIASEVGILVPSFSRILDKIDQDGLVEVYQADDDRRAIVVFISSKGKKLLKKVESNINEACKNVDIKAQIEKLNSDIADCI